MNKILIILVLPIFLITTNLYSSNIVVLDIEDIINTNDQYIKIIKEINISQKNNSFFLNKYEKTLEDLKNEIDSSKIILESSEINNMIVNYNNQLEEYKIIVDNFNLHYQNEIVNVRKYILKEIIVLAEKYAKNHDIDLILDSTSYLIASNKINITIFIKEKLNEINLKLEFKHFEKD